MNLRLVGALAVLLGSAAWGEEATCESLKGVASPASTQKVRVVFVSRADHTRSLYWLDFEGHRKLYTHLKPGETYEVDSFVGHAWVMLDRRRHCVRGFVVSGPEQVIIE